MNKKTIVKYLGWLMPLALIYYRTIAVAKFGFGRYLRIRFGGVREGRFDHFLCIAACAKNEGHEFAEWIEYHRMLGVEKFYIYDNESDDNTREVLAPYIAAGVVDLTTWPGKKQQMAIYKHAVMRLESQTKWLAVIDLDEFINPIAFNSISDFLHTVPQGVSEVYLAWEQFGSSGHKKRPAGLVIENYDRVGYVSRRGKLIVNPRTVVGLSNPHVFEVVGRVVDENFKPFRIWDWVGKVALSERREFPKRRIKVNHYWLKSFEEFASKAVRGRANGKPGDVAKYSPEAFARKDDNSREDRTIMRFAAAVKKRLG